MRISDEDYLWFAGRALDGMAAILAELGDERANRRPPLPGCIRHRDCASYPLNGLAWRSRLVSALYGPRQLRLGGVA